MTLLEKLKVSFPENAILAAFLVFLAGFAVGAWVKGRGTKTVTTKEVQTVTQVQKVVDEQLVEAEVQKRVAAETAKMSQHVVTTVITRKDGTVIRKQVKDTDTDRETKVSSSDAKQETQTKIQYVDRIVEKTVTQTKTVDAAPRWMLALSAEVPPAQIFKSGLGLQTLGLGLDVRYRILGPFWIGGSLRPVPLSVGAAVGFSF